MVTALLDVKTMAISACRQVQPEAQKRLQSRRFDGYGARKLHGDATRHATIHARKLAAPY
jgi:hypothetical protein